MLLLVICGVISLFPVNSVTMCGIIVSCPTIQYLGCRWKEIAKQEEERKKWSTYPYLEKELRWNSGGSMFHEAMKI